MRRQFLFLLVCLPICPVVADEPVVVDAPEIASSEPKVDEQAINEAIKQLDSDNFPARQQAAKDLLGFGNQAKPMLLQLLKTGSVEARGAATRIIADIEAGISTNTTDAQSEILRKFQSGNQADRALTVTSMLTKGDLELLPVLIERIDDPTIKQNLFRQSLSSTPIMLNLIAARKLEWWTGKAAERNASLRRQDVIVDWLTSDDALRELQSRNQLSVLEDLFAQEPHDASRFALAKAFLSRPSFVATFTKASNIDLLLSLFDLRSNPAGRQDLLLTLIRADNARVLLRSETLPKVISFIKEKTPAETNGEIKIALLNLIAASPDATKNLRVASFLELSAGLTEAEFGRALDHASKQPMFVYWLLDPDHFRPLLDWVTTLPANSRNAFVTTTCELIEARQSATERVLADPATLELFWQLIDALPKGEAQQNAKLSLAPLLSTESYVHSDQRADLMQLILANKSPAADSALQLMLRQSLYRERIFDDVQEVRTHFQRIAEFDTKTSSLMTNAYQYILSANAVRGHFADAENSRWLLDEYVPSLSPEVRSVAVQAMCTSERLIQTWQEKPFLEQLLSLAKEQPDMTARAQCIAPILRYERLSELANDDPKIALVQLYRDPSLPKAARVAFMKSLASNSAFFAWLENRNEVAEFVDLVEQLDAPVSPGESSESSTRSLYYNPTYVALLAKLDRLDPWFEAIASDEYGPSRALTTLLQQPGILTPEFLERNQPRLLRIADSISDHHQRGSYLTELLLSPPSLKLHAQKGELAELIHRIGAEENLLVQATLLRSLTKYEVITVLSDSGELDAVIAMLRQLPAERTPSALYLVGHPILLNHLAKTEQVDFVFEMVSRGPMTSSLYANGPMIQLLIDHGYVDRLLASANEPKVREMLASRLLASSAAITHYTKENRLNELVELFEQIEPSMNRDTAIKSLFSQQEMASLMLKELGVDKSFELVSSIQYGFYLAQARSHLITALCSLEKVPESRLRQLLVDVENSGMLSPARRQGLLEGPVGEQLITAGLLPQVKQVFLKGNRPQDQRITKPLDEFYSSPLVLRHLDENSDMDELIEHMRTMRDPNEVSAFARQLIRTPEGCQIILSSKHFPVFASMIESISEYYQSNFWGLFCADRNVIAFVSRSEDSKAVVDYLQARKHTSNELERLIVQIAQEKQLDEVVANESFVKQLVGGLPRLGEKAKFSVASHLSRHPSAVWKMVESGQWDALAAILDCEATEELRTSRWRSAAQPQVGLVSALVAADQQDRAIEVLRKVSESPWHFALSELWIRLATGTLDQTIEAMEARSDSLQEGEWRWLSWAYRAQAKDEQAIAAARKSGDHSLVTALAIERGDWNEVVALLNQSAAPQTHLPPHDDETRLLEHQGMLLVSRLYANQPDQMQTPIDEILALRAKSNNLRVRSRCCDALLLAEHFEPALSYLDQHFIHRALRLRLHQGEYAAAIKVAKWDPENPRAFLAAVRASTGSDWGAFQATAELLKAMSHDKRHHEMRLLHDAMMQSILEKPEVHARTSLLFGYSMQLYRNELFELYWLALEQADLMPLLLHGLLSAHALDESDRLLSLSLPRLIHGKGFAQPGPNDRPAVMTALKVADEAIRLNVIAKDQLDQWVQSIAKSPGDWANRTDEALAVGILCMNQSRIDDAIRILEPLGKTRPLAFERLARDAWRRQDWSNAARYYGQLNLNARDRLDAMYLSGLAMSRTEAATADDQNAAEAKMAQAMACAFHPASQIRVALELQKLGEIDRCNNWLMNVVRQAPHHGSLQMDAIWHLKANARNPEAMIHWCQQWQILQTRYIYGNGDQTEFLKVPATLRQPPP